MYDSQTPTEEEIVDDLPREGWIWLTKRGRAVWTLGGNKVVSEEGGFQTQVAEKRKSPVVRKKKKKNLAKLAMWKKLEATDILKRYKDRLIQYHSLWLRLEVLCGQGGIIPVVFGTC